MKSTFELLSQVAQHLRRPSGYIFMAEDCGYSEAVRQRESHWREVGMTLQCPHCGGHFISVRGSGNLRAFCRRCMAPLCDKRECIEHCIPFEKKLGLYEKGKMTYLG